MKRIVAGAAVMLLTMLASTALAARPPGGARYVGTTSQGQKITLRVTSDGKGLQMELSEKLTCNRGGPISTNAHYAKQRPTIRATGTFD